MLSAGLVAVPVGISLLESVDPSGTGLCFPSSSPLRWKDQATFYNIDQEGTGIHRYGIYILILFTFLHISYIFLLYNNCDIDIKHHQKV